MKPIGKPNYTRANPRMLLAAAGFMLAWIAMTPPSEAGFMLGSSGLSLAPDAAKGTALQEVLFYHRKRVEPLYCVERSYWWYYRPYQSPDDDYPRCMPYFRYPGPPAGPPPLPGGRLK